MAKKPPVKYQGKAVVTRCGECGACQEWMLLASSAPYCTHMLVMMPDGSVEHGPTAVIVERKVRAWFKAAMREDAFNVGLIEWRADLLPPDMLSKANGGRAGSQV